MIPLTPKFLLAAAHAMASHTPPEIARHAVEDGAALWDADASYAFVQRAGYWSHYRRAARWSAWPLRRSKTLDEAAERATRELVLREDAVPGAIGLVAWPRHESDGRRFAQCGIITDVRGASFLPDVHEIHTDVTWAVVDPTGASWAIDVPYTFDVARGDRFLHWWHLEALVPLRRAA